MCHVLVYHDLFIDLGWVCLSRTLRPNSSPVFALHVQLVTWHKPALFRRLVISVGRLEALQGISFIKPFVFSMPPYAHWINVYIREQCELNFEVCSTPMDVCFISFCSIFHNRTPGNRFLE